VFELNVPNVLTLLRILLVPVLVVALLEETANGDILAAVVFAIASLTDFVDGWLARSSNAVTTFGKLMDPIADKLLVIAALVSLVSLDRLAAWVAMVIIARELAVTIARAQAPEVIPAATLGKLKTVTQVVAIFFLILLHPAPGWVDALVYIAVAVTVVSGLTFFLSLRQRPAASSHSRIEV
jgi:CDP-diacylglycerol--glycerol-3-phosphate 3-phosphatidyltransferase